MEGIIAKRKDSIYRRGRRTSDWLKIKARLQQEFVVGGFTEPKGSRKYLGAVVLGAHTGGKSQHYGYAGSGFSEKGLKDAVERMKPLFTDKCPFVNPPNIKEEIQWVRPKLVCEVEYTELTADDQLRQTTFLGWRDDKKPERSGFGATIEGMTYADSPPQEHAASNRELSGRNQAVSINGVNNLPIGW